MATEKQTRAVKLTLENSVRDKPLTDKEIMAKAGYGEVIQNSPKQVKNSKGFQELLEELLPDSKLFKRHNQLLDKKEYRREVNDEGRVIVKKTEEIDTNAVAKGLDMAYKLKGKYIEHRVLDGVVKHEHSQDVNNFLELQAVKLEFEKKLKETLMQEQKKEIET